MFAELKLAVSIAVFAAIVAAVMYVMALQKDLEMSEMTITALKGDLRLQNQAIDTLAKKNKDHEKIVLDYKKRADAMATDLQAKAKAVRNVTRDTSLTDCQDALRLGNDL